MNLEVLIEAERRGFLPKDKAALLAEARKRGLVQPGQTQPPKATPQLGVAPQPANEMQAAQGAPLSQAGIEGSQILSNLSRNFSVQNSQDTGSQPPALQGNAGDGDSVIIDMQDGRKVQFPKGMSLQEMAAALNKMPPTSGAPQMNEQSNEFETLP